MRLTTREYHIAKGLAHRVDIGVDAPEQARRQLVNDVICVHDGERWVYALPGGSTTPSPDQAVQAWVKSLKRPTVEIADVVTYEASDGAMIDLTPRQIAACEAAGVWPKNARNEEMTGVRRGLHRGNPLTDAEVEQACGVVAGTVFGGLQRC